MKFRQVILLAVFVGLCTASISLDFHQQRWGGLTGFDLCPTCVSFSEQAINNLLNIVLNAGVIEGCGKICGLLENKTHNQPIGVVCNLLCDIVGVQAFVDLIQKADLDPIYYCELLDLCPVNDHGDAMITNLTVTPKSGPQGTFVIEVEYLSKNGTGTGEMAVDVMTADLNPLGSTFLLESLKAGGYKGSVKVKAVPDPDCDPTQGPCEDWLPGVYNVSVALCNGECGSKHPHSRVYDQKLTSFTITEG